MLAHLFTPGARRAIVLTALGAWAAALAATATALIGA